MYVRKYRILTNLRILLDWNGPPNVVSYFWPFKQESDIPQPMTQS